MALRPRLATGLPLSAAVSVEPADCCYMTRRTITCLTMLASQSGTRVLEGYS